MMTKRDREVSFGVVLGIASLAVAAFFPWPLAAIFFGVIALLALGLVVA
jgi:hypothetical protein